MEIQFQGRPEILSVSMNGGRLCGVSKRGSSLRVKQVGRTEKLSVS